jgi:hypothetical protein
VRPGGAPGFNFRSEGRHFADSNRCLIPASAFFEFTGKKCPKATPVRPEGITDRGYSGPVDRGAGQPSADVHDVDDGARTRRRPVPQLASRGGPARKLVCLDLPGYMRFAVSNAARPISRFAARASTSSPPLVRTTLNGQADTAPAKPLTA